MHSRALLKQLIATGLAMLALCVGIRTRQAMRRVAKTLAAMRRSVVVALAALTFVCVVEAGKNRGGNGDDGRVDIMRTILKSY